MKKVIRRSLIRSWAPGLVSLGFFLLSCTIGIGEKIDKEESEMFKKSDNNLQVILQIGKTTYQLRAPIFMELSITNKKTNGPVELLFTSSQRYDFIVKNQNQEIWRWSKDKLFAMMLGEIVLKAGGYLRYTETWDQRDNKGELILPGRYEIVGVLKTHPEIVSEPVTVGIKPGFAASPL